MDAKPQELEPQFPPANIWMRMVAFGLDMLLVLAALHMIHLMLPATAHEFIKDMQGEQVTFKEMLYESQKQYTVNTGRATGVFTQSCASPPTSKQC